MDGRMKRRGFLGLAAAGVTGLTSQLPETSASVTLDLAVSPLRWRPNADGYVSSIVLRLANHEPERRITPTVNVWGTGRHTQHHWPIVGEVPTLEPGDVDVVRIEGPSDSNRGLVHPGVPAQIKVFDEPTESRAVVNWTPPFQTGDTDGGGRDGHR